MRLLTGLIMNPGAAGPDPELVLYFQCLVGSELAEQQQNEQHDQNEAAKAHPGMAHAIAIAAEPAAEAAQQQNDHDDDEYRSKRHRILPKGASRMTIRPPHLQKSKFEQLGPAKEPGARISAAVSARPNCC